MTWSADGSVRANQADTAEIGTLKPRFADLPRKGWAGGAGIEFTFFGKEAQRWGGGNYPVAVAGPTQKDNHDVAKPGAAIR